MTMQKFRADAVFDGYQLLDGNQVLITNEPGEILDLVHPDEAGDGIQHLHGMLCPGFVNCHCHLELSHLKGAIPEKTGLPGFLKQVMQLRNEPEAKQLLAIEEAETAMLINGIVAVGDICNTSITLPQKQQGRIWYHNFIETMGWLPGIASTRFQQAASVFYQFAAQYAVPVESNSIVPHAPYSVSEELWQKIIHFPGNRLLSLHSQEDEAENHFFLSGNGDFISFYNDLKIDSSHFFPPGKSSLQACLPYLQNNQSLILVHNVVTSEEDVLFAKQIKNKVALYWCLCPNANVYISGKLPPAELLTAAGCDIVLGTDSLASNHELSILSEVQTLKNAYPNIAPASLLQWATSNGAKAMQLDGILGSFEKGKKPGVLLLANDLSAVRRLV